MLVAIDKTLMVYDNRGRKKSLSIKKNTKLTVRIDNMTHYELVNHSIKTNRTINQIALSAIKEYINKGQYNEA